MKLLHLPKSALPSTNKLLTIILLLSTLIYITVITLTSSSLISITKIPNTSNSQSPTSTLHNIAFGIASNRNSWPKKQEYVKLWWKPNTTRGCIFLDESSTMKNNTSLPPVCVSADTSRFRYTYRHGLRSAIRIARIITETVNLNLTNIHWYVFGDDDTVFFPENLAATLSKYNHELWYYIGTHSETYDQNRLFSFNMAFGGAGFAISSSLARVMSRVFDSCLERYPHLYGSDARVYSCFTELGVGLTREPGFHQMDIKGDAFGLLTSHSLTPIVSLHHLDKVNPIFPNMKTQLESFQHLYKAVHVDSSRVLQKTVCYDHWFSWTISVSWGYAVEIHDQHILLPDVLRTEETFRPWKTNQSGFMLDSRPKPTTDHHINLCGGGRFGTTVFFFDQILKRKDGVIESKYVMKKQDMKCKFDRVNSPTKLKEVVVYSRKYEVGMEQLLAPRRQCCDALLPGLEERMEITIRECKQDELTYMHP